MVTKKFYLRLLERNNVSMIASFIGFFMVMLDVTIVNVALPSIQEAFHVNISGLQWIIAGYVLTFSSFLLLAGSLTDSHGSKPVLLCGLSLFTVTSFCCAYATHIFTLVLFRLLQGVSAALILPSSLKLVISLCQDKISNSKTIGIWASVGGMAAAIGPILGSLLIHYFGWRSIFLINIPLGLMCITFIFSSKSNFFSNAIAKFQEQFKNFREKNKAVVKLQNGIDYIGQVWGTLTVGSLAFTLIEAGEGIHKPIVWISFTVFLISLSLFLLMESRISKPMLPLYLFKSKSFSAAVLIGMALNISFYGELFILPLYFQKIRGYSILMAGMAITPQTFLAALASYLGGKISAVIGHTTPIIIGLIIGAIGFLFMLNANEHSPSYLSLILPLSAIGFGTALTMPALTIAVVNAVNHNNSGMATSILNTSRQVGSLIGVAMFGSIINSAHSFVFGMHFVLVLASSIFLIGAVITYAFVGENKSVQGYLAKCIYMLLILKFKKRQLK